jgi:hypothetical protein
MTGETDGASRAMLKGLHDALAEELRRGFEAAAKPVIDEAVAETMKNFELSINQFLDPSRMAHIIEVVLRDRREGRL